MTLPVLRTEPEDFRVEELPLYPASGDGSHTFLQIEKRLRNSDEVARELARATGCSARDIGYAGRKDRVAVTRQWFSVPALDPEVALALPLTRSRVLSAVRHGHKLRTGQLRGNRFEIVLRNVTPEVAGRAAARLPELQRKGFPNRFGAQRFGRDGDNATRARALLSGKLRSRDHRRDRFLLSALQSEVFNEVLRRRPLPLDRLELGDLAVVHESGGLFPVADLSREQERADRFEISPTGPIFGNRTDPALAEVGAREQAILDELEIPHHSEWKLPRALRMRGARRALRVRPEDAECGSEADRLTLRFTLPPGAYATVLVEEWVGAVEVSQGPPAPPPSAG